MTLFTDGLVVNRDRNILDDVASGQFDAAEAAAGQAFFENPTVAAHRINELTDAQEGDVLLIQPSPWDGRGPARDLPSSPMLSQEEAQARVKDSGLDITVEPGGIRAGALDILIERKRAERERQFVLQNAPASTVPVQLLAGFATSVIDPINLASAFIPVVGEARYAAMLARAGTVAGRLGVRASVGAIEGAAGAAIVEPLILRAAAQDQSDYDMSDSLLNIAFGTVLGGGLHSVGGAISDIRKRSLEKDLISQEPQPEQINTPVSAQEPVQTKSIRVNDDPFLSLQDSLRRGLEADREELRSAASRQAQEELMPVIRQELESIASGKIPNVADLRAESSLTGKAIDALDSTFKARAKEYQRQGQSRKKAESSARKEIEAERQRLEGRRNEIAQSLDTNKQSELARAGLAQLRRGEIPQIYRERVQSRAKDIAGGYDLASSARRIAEAAPWEVRHAALKSAVAQAVTGRPVDVEPVFGMADPLTRKASMDTLKATPARVVDADAEQVSARAEEAARITEQPDLESATQEMDDEVALTDEMAAQAGIDVSAEYKQADELLADAETYAAAYRAAAICQLRN